MRVGESISTMNQLRAKYASLHEKNPDIVPETPDPEFGNKSYIATWKKACDYFDLIENPERTTDTWTVNVGTSWHREKSNALNTSSEASSERIIGSLFPEFFFEMLYTFSTIEENSTAACTRLYKMLAKLDAKKLGVIFAIIVVIVAMGFSSETSADVKRAVAGAKVNIQKDNESRFMSGKLMKDVSSCATQCKALMENVTEMTNGIKHEVDKYKNLSAPKRRLLFRKLKKRGIKTLKMAAKYLANWVAEHLKKQKAKKEQQAVAIPEETKKTCYQNYLQITQQHEDLKGKLENLIAEKNAQKAEKAKKRAEAILVIRRKKFAESLSNEAATKKKSNAKDQQGKSKKLKAEKKVQKDQQGESKKLKAEKKVQKDQQGESKKLKPEKNVQKDQKGQSENFKAGKRTKVLQAGLKYARL